MRLSELRAIASGLSREQLAKLLVEVYRSVPKAARESAELDDILHAPSEVGEKHPKKAEEPVPGIVDLRFETELFAKNAYAQNYVAPNRAVSKRDRPKWRFVVMRLYKGLQSAARDAGAQKEAAGLLLSLYEVLLKACDEYIFSAYDPFESIKIPQEEFFRSVLSLQQRTLSRDAFVAFAVTHATQDTLNRYTLHEGLIEAAMDFFKTPGHREQALQACFGLRQGVAGRPTMERYGSYSKYKQGRDMNAVTQMVFSLLVSLHDYEAAIADFRANGRYDNPEISLYRLLLELYRFGQKELLLREYDEGVKRGITPREGLRKMVQDIRDAGRLPQYFD